MRKILPLMIILILTLSACGNGSATRAGKDSIPSQEPAPPFASQSTSQSTAQPTSQSTALSTQQSSASRASGTPMKTSGVAAKAPGTTADTPDAKPVVVQPSRSLAGHDRFLVSQPFNGIRPADFELGLLMDRTFDPESITPLLDGLAQALTGKNLETAGFSSQGLVLASLLYDPALDAAPTITTVRYSELRRLPGTRYAVALRLFSETGSADGLAIFGADEDGSWLIEQLDLDLAELDKPVTRNELWDPYGYSRNLME